MRWTLLAFLVAGWLIAASPPWAKVIGVTLALVAARRITLVERSRLRELVGLALTDPVGGCLNRRGFEHHFARAVKRARERSGNLAILAIDVDHFKRINDAHGHLAGDRVLHELAQLLCALARPADRVARVGGEEFLVLVPDCDAEEAGAIAEQVRASVHQRRFAALPPTARLTVSVGVAVEAMHDLAMTASLRARADEALYVGKRLGRNRAVMWAPGIRSNATPPRGEVRTPTWSSIIS
ncbi:MAG: putative rane protein [Gemmatimonadetes bacterium]|nr:putative rane protein [Gemmatimonadota bacterium]